MTVDTFFKCSIFLHKTYLTKNDVMFMAGMIADFYANIYINISLNNVFIIIIIFRRASLSRK